MGGGCVKGEADEVGCDLVVVLCLMVRQERKNLLIPKWVRDHMHSPPSNLCESECNYVQPKAVVAIVAFNRPVASASGHQIAPNAGITVSTHGRPRPGALARGSRAHARAQCWNTFRRARGAGSWGRALWAHASTLEA